MGGRVGVDEHARCRQHVLVRAGAATVTAAADPVRRRPLHRPRRRSPRAQGLDVLLAEDNPVNSAVAARHARRATATGVVVAENGVAVLARSSSSDFDVVLMDCHMPEMDGFEATPPAAAPRGDRVRVIALTASAMDDERARCFAVGMDDFLSKPLTAENLRDALQRARAERDAAA